MQEIEIEFKNILTKLEYNQLKECYFADEQPVKQVNYYLDTDTFTLAKHRYALRIREKNEKFTLTLKQPHQDGILETHAVVTKAELANWLLGKPVVKDNIERQLKALNMSLLQTVHYGHLTTFRLESAFEDIILVLDHSLYNDREDFELEIEAPTKELGSLKIEEILTKNNIERKEAKTKNERFFKSLPVKVQAKLKSEL